MAADCASLRFRSYRYNNTSSGTITRRELDVPYLANLKTLEGWIGFMARFVPFSTSIQFLARADCRRQVRSCASRRRQSTELLHQKRARAKILDWR